MKKNSIPFSELRWPRGLNLDHLTRVMPEELLRKFIVAYSRLDRKNRRIMLPSLKCIRKVLCHHLWSKIEDGSKTWDEVKGDLKEEFKTLKSLGLKKHKVKRMYEQREKEIEREKS